MSDVVHTRTFNCWVTHFHLPFMSFLESLCESSYLFLCYPLSSFCKLSFFFYPRENQKVIFVIVLWNVFSSVGQKNSSLFKALCMVHILKRVPNVKTKQKL